MHQFIVTEDAGKMIHTLRMKHGKIIFHQSGGCCDGSAPMCFEEGELMSDQNDVLWGYVLDCPFYISKFQYELWKHTELTLDIVKGRGSSFSLEIPYGVRFVTKSQICMTRVNNITKQ